jgi:hypothetical protein
MLQAMTLSATNNVERIERKPLSNSKVIEKQKLRGFLARLCPRHVPEMRFSIWTYHGA